MSEDVNGVAAYRKNGRSVEGLSREELSDMLERYPSDSDAFMAASQQLAYYDRLDEQAPCYPKDARNLDEKGEASE